VEEVIGIDYNSATQQYARQAASELGWREGKLQLVTGRAEKLPLEDASVDAVVGTHVSVRRGREV
jgi:ubiquinone/menaquinone biosynthesis C-methylase UbiE